MEPLFRLPAATDHDPAIDAWLNRHGGALGALAQRWFRAMRACGDDVREVLHDGFPTVCVGDAAFAHVAVFSAHVNVGFFQGAALPDPASLLQGNGRSMRHVKLKPGQPIDDDAIRALIVAAHADMQRRTGAG